jgi:hypothetical protein
MRWTQAALLTRARALRTAKSCGPDAPTLASSRRMMFRRRRRQESPVSGESAKETVKTIRAGNAGRLRRPAVTTLVCFLVSHARLRVRAARPAFPAPFFSGAIILHGPGAVQAAGMRRRVKASLRGASATKQSSLCHSGARRSREPGNHTHDWGYGFRALASRAPE